jgi:uncharacterized protein YuzE
MSMADRQIGKETYFSLTRGPVNCSHQIHDDVIADYDAGGNVVGLEFLTAEAASQREKFLALAKQKSPGRISVAKPPSSGRSKAA